MDERLNLSERVARLEERVAGATEASRLVARQLEEYKVAANEWRQALNDQRTGYATRVEVIALLTVGLTLLGLILHFTAKGL